MKLFALLAFVVLISGCTGSQQSLTEPLDDVQEPLVPTGEVKSFTLEGDDEGFYPGSTLTVNRGDTVNITFVIRTENVYRYGLEVRSPVFNTGRIYPGESYTVSFVADKSFTFTSHWPSTAILKATGELVVL